MVTVGALLCPATASAQRATSLAVLRGLVPVTTLGGTDAGRAALAANLTVTGAIQDGTSAQPTLLPFADQQQQALRDAFITDGNAYQLADGLGTSLGNAYQRLTSVTRDADGNEDFTNVSPSVANVIAFASNTTKADSNAGKYFFANATTDGKEPVSAEASSILRQAGGVTDVFGKAYARPAGSEGADAYGNSRPFQTEPHLVTYDGPDFFGAPSDSSSWLRGPAQDLVDSPSFPSGHTTYGYTESLVLALLVPDRYPEMMARAAEYGNDRIIIGAHFAMDVLGGRTLATYDMAHLLANTSQYVGVDRGGVRIDDFRQALAAARNDLSAALATACGNAVAACARDDQSRFSQPEANAVFVDTTQTYGLPSVFGQNAVDVGKVAPEAGYLLTAAYPYLSLDQANAILTQTLGPGGGFLDDGSSFGVYSRLDLHRAAQRAVEVAPR
ncbi:phosphatase PAP2 family protein [Mycobacterium yunnanensis]|uniref:Phosphatase PAP2 family protein n=2 Tax=Mycobacterium yunnanensis TaxID=368477 RepID=A0A9X2YYS0_9MYCO|nr:phosphatase PAP2 family protein [Mycobacterium yunnanensis]